MKAPVPGRPVVITLSRSPVMSHAILSRAKTARCSGIISPADGTTLELEKKGGIDKIFVLQRL